jgi:hypothetical protein
MYIAEAQGKQAVHDPVLPSASWVVKRKRDLQSLGGENLGNGLLVLITSVNLAPRPAHAALAHSSAFVTYRRRPCKPIGADIAVLFEEHRSFVPQVVASGEGRILRRMRR